MKKWFEKLLMNTRFLELAIVSMIGLLVCSIIALVTLSASRSEERESAMSTGRCDYFVEGSNQRIECVLRRMEREGLKIP